MKVKVKKPLKQKDQFPLAVKYNKEGNMPMAVKILETMLKSNPQDYDALTFLGGIHLSVGNCEKAVEYFEKIVAIIQNHPTAFYNLGLSYQRLHKLEKAEENYKKALKLNPKNLDALNNLGVICSTLGRKDEAQEYYNKALYFNENNPKVYNNIGNLLSSQELYTEAEPYYFKAISYEPENFSYKINLADCYIKQEKLNTAEDVLEEIIKIKPDYAEAYNTLGLIFLKRKDYEKANTFFEKAIKVKEDFWEAYQNMGFSYERMDKNSEAIETYQRVLDINKDNAKAMMKLSGLYIEGEEYFESEKYLNILNGMDNNEARLTSYVNLGLSKLKQGNINDAILFSKKALEENDQIAVTHYNYAHALLLKGNFEEGWKEYEWRKKRTDFEQRTLSKPELTDQDINGKRILVCEEQGLGDSIQFIRFLPKLKEHGAYVILECGERLIDLYKNFEGADQIILKNAASEPDVEYDYYISMLSLPHYFNTDLSAIPQNVPYLFPEQNLIEKWEKIVDNDYLKVGISWAGNPKNTYDKRRSCRLKDLEKLFDIPNVKFYSLQKGEPVKQIYELDTNKIVDLDALMDGMATTAAAIKNFDLVISVDTSIAHLAGATGANVWLMLPFVPDWRWLLDRRDSPWYPSVRIFRQSETKSWDIVVDSMKAELLKLVKNKFGENILSDNFIPAKSKNLYDNILHLGLPQNGNFGWGVCSKYLKKELSKKIQVRDSHNASSENNLINGDVFHALTTLEFDSETNVRGKRNFAYTFFESELIDKSVENASKYDLILGGSTWCKERMDVKGIKNTGVLLQGIDPELFYPVPERKQDNLFIIFSGGKFELRKGQDLVIKAFEILHKKYPDMILINAWYNFWPASVATMAYSRYINFEMKDSTWNEFVVNILSKNNINPQKVFTLPITPNEKLRELYSKTDIGLFPNRCEGGTNLVLMEYMACGKPVIASYNSGHKDILTNENSFMLESMGPCKLLNEKEQLTFNWEEPDLDEIIEKIEFAYHNREKMKTVGNKAAEDMKRFTWENTAENLIKIIFGQN